MPDRPLPDYVTDGNLLEDKLAFNPEYEIIRMDYPVHMHPAENTPDLKGEYFALVFRSPETGFVHFLNLSRLNTFILTRLVEEDVPVKILKGEIARASGIESSRFLEEALEKFIGDLMEKKLILGFQKE